MDALNKQRPRAYTSVMSLMETMAKKGLLRQKPKGRAFMYSAKLSRRKALSDMVKDLVSRAFDGSASSLVAHLLHQSTPDNEELAEIRKVISEFSRKGGA
jgi:predicted transcriptional regulator